jgi:CRISPR-associated endoribonuclease cas2
LAIYVVAYDFSNNRLRSKIGKILENYGRRIQKSVFQCFLTTDQIHQFKKEANILLKTNSDIVCNTDSIIIVEDIKEDKINEVFSNNCNIKNEKIFF